MKKFLLNLKFLFKLLNVLFIIVYLFPGSLLGCFFYKNCGLQPQLTDNFIVSSNHVYVFLVISLTGFFIYHKEDKIKFVLIYLIFISIFLELLHHIIPNRGFQFADLFGNIVGVVISLIFFNLYNYAKKILF
jgi:VanZ family protein